MSLLAYLHALAALQLSAYALHQGMLLFLYLWRRFRPAQLGQTAHTSVTPLSNADAPFVTIQIPLYNERFVTERIIQALVALNYPRECLQVQILDDSTDETTEIARCAVDAASANGLNIQLLHRDNRDGYKAGALAAALPQAQGEFIAIFDADFVPSPDFLQRLLLQRRAFDDPQVGFVQTRWGYLNRDQNTATRAQAMMLDMHFVIEQPARNQSGLLMSFNGSGGIWRRSCIEQSGGWQHDTLTEDLDLCYRAQIIGWRGIYLADEVSPGELPPDVLAFKRQQARWARGTLQCVRKLIPRVMQSELKWWQKLGACMHMTGYFIHPLILLMAVTTPLLLIRSLFGDPAARLPVWLNFFSGISLAPILAMMVASHSQGRGIGQFIRDLPATLLLGIGVAFSNSFAMLMGLLSRESGEFVRTPKVAAATSASARARPSTYAPRPNWTMWIELGLTAYGVGALLLLLNLGYWWSAAPTLLYTCGFGIVGISQLFNRAQR